MSSKTRRELGEGWITSSEYCSTCLPISAAKFHEVNDLLFKRPNLNSSHLFRADILYDSSNTLETITTQNGEEHGSFHSTSSSGLDQSSASSRRPGAPSFEGYVLQRTVVRRLVPRKPQLDWSLDQSCFLYTCEEGQERHLVVLVPIVEQSEDVPWYHPPVKSLAYSYAQLADGASLSVSYLPFSNVPGSIPDRIHRTMISLLQTFIRLSRLESHSTPATNHSVPSARSLIPSAIRDTILPQHVVQDTYSRLKQSYAADLIARWVESTEPSKHVFEDLSIAAFLIELWRSMYDLSSLSNFPGFVDIACGNGILVYVLRAEGFQGHGFDARRRKTWEILGIDEYLEERICIPKPFRDEADPAVIEHLHLHDGLFSPGTFIIANHADELTPWTPILAALSDPARLLPFLAIPCCSHALSGQKHRYTFGDIDIAHAAQAPSEPLHQPISTGSSTGDLKALRAEKQKAAQGDDKSQYACLTKKVVAMAEEIGFDTEITMMRIPSTRNIGIVGNRLRAAKAAKLNTEFDALQRTDDAATLISGSHDALERIAKIVDRECARTGGLNASARSWIERAIKLTERKGRGKVNWGRPKPTQGSKALHPEANSTVEVSHSADQCINLDT